MSCVTQFLELSVGSPVRHPGLIGRHNFQSLGVFCVADGRQQTCWGVWLNTREIVSKRGVPGCRTHDGNVVVRSTRGFRHFCTASRATANIKSIQQRSSISFVQSSALPGEEAKQQHFVADLPPLLVLRVCSCHQKDFDILFPKTQKTYVCFVVIVRSCERKTGTWHEITKIRLGTRSSTAFRCLLFAVRACANIRFDTECQRRCHFAYVYNFT